MLLKLEQILLFLVLLTLPTQLGKHFWPTFSYVYSLPIDYLSPTIYLWDLLVLGLLIIFILNRKALNRVALNILFIFLFSQLIPTLLGLLNHHPQNLGAGLVRAQQYVIIGLFGVYLASYRFDHIKEKIVLPVSLAVLGESILAILQFIKGGTIGLWILGERTFTLSTPAIAKFDFLGRQFLRPYASFPHPNTLAAFLVLTIPLLSLGSKVKLTAVTIFLALVSILLTVSRLSILALLVEALFLLKKKWIILTIGLVLLLLPILYIRYSSVLNFDELSLIRREGLSDLSWQIFLSEPFWGVGLSNFIPIASDQLLVGPSRFLQPVHNIFLLTLAETGLLGFLGLVLLFGYPIFRLVGSPKSSSGATLLLLWEMIIFLGLFDHYFLTQPQGLRVLFLIWGLSLSLVSSKIDDDAKV